MTIILTEKEVHDAIQASLGLSYNVQAIKLIASRGRNATRVEVEVERVEPKIEEAAKPTTVSRSGPIFDTVHGE
jgi:hypothetical protein